LTSDEEADALVTLLTHTIDGDRYPLSQRIGTQKTILAKLRPEPPRAPLPPLKTYPRPRFIRGRRRRG
jgi:hypothetical protein